MNYFITSIYLKDGIFPWQKNPEKRTFGYFKTLNRAFRAVEKNECDLEECFYNYLVIEGIDPGIHSSVKVDYWFEWNGSRWRRISSKPEKLNGLCNWALG